MAKLIVNDVCIDKNYDANIPEAQTALFVSEMHGENAVFYIELNAQEKNQQTKKKIRTEIREKVGDTASILGTTADAVQMLLVFNSQLTIEISKTKSTELKALREACKPWLANAEKLISKMADGTIKMPYQNKGVDQVASEITRSATAVAEILTPSPQPSPSGRGSK